MISRWQFVQSSRLTVVTTSICIAATSKSSETRSKTTASEISRFKRKTMTTLGRSSGQSGRLKRLFTRTCASIRKSITSLALFTWRGKTWCISSYRNSKPSMEPSTLVLFRGRSSCRTNLCSLRRQCASKWDALLAQPHPLHQSCG